MTAFARVLILGAVAVLAFDTLGSLAAKTLAFSYSSLSIGSFLIYAVTGFFAARAAGLPASIGAGALVALIEATIGWAISWAIGPGRLPTGLPGTATLVRTVVIVTLTGALIGFVGGAISRALGSRVAA